MILNCLSAVSVGQKKTKSTRAHQLMQSFHFGSTLGGAGGRLFAASLIPTNGAQIFFQSFFGFWLEQL
jgi:hypothetical protein